MGTAVNKYTGQQQLDLLVATNFRTTQVNKKYAELEASEQLAIDEYYGELEKQIKGDKAFASEVLKKVEGTPLEPMVLELGATVVQAAPVTTDDATPDESVSADQSPESEPGDAVDEEPVAEEPAPKKESKRGKAST